MAHIARAGQFVKQASGYTAFVPAPLPPEPPVEMDLPMVGLLSNADQAVGRLDGVTAHAAQPGPVRGDVRPPGGRLSSQIEGTQSTLEDLLAFELDPRRRDVPRGRRGGRQLRPGDELRPGAAGELPLSLRLIREIHARAAERRARRRASCPASSARPRTGSARAAPASPGDLRPAACPRDDGGARRPRAVSCTTRRLPVLVRCGLAHAQFETIHPFLDGNGRVGRLLITFLLVHAACCTGRCST